MVEAVAASVAAKAVDAAKERVLDIAQYLLSLYQLNAVDIPNEIQRVLATTARVRTCVAGLSTAYMSADVVRQVVVLYGQLWRTRYVVDLYGCKKGSNLGQLYRRLRPQQVLDELGKLDAGLVAAYGGLSDVLEAVGRYGFSLHVTNTHARGFWREAGNQQTIARPVLLDALKGVALLPTAEAEEVLKRATDCKLFKAEGDVSVWAFNSFIKVLTDKLPPPPAAAAAGAAAAAAGGAGAGTASPFVRTAPFVGAAAVPTLRVVLHHAKLNVKYDPAFFDFGRLSPKAVITFPADEKAVVKHSHNEGPSLKHSPADDGGHLDPQWDFKCEFTVPQLAAGAPASRLGLYVFRKVRLHHELLGRAFVDVSAALRAPLLPHLLSANVIAAASADVVGRVWFTMEFVPATADPHFGFWDPTVDAAVPTLDALLHRFVTADEKALEAIRQQADPAAAAAAVAAAAAAAATKPSAPPAPALIIPALPAPPVVVPSAADAKDVANEAALVAELQHLLKYGVAVVDGLTALKRELVASRALDAARAREFARAAIVVTDRDKAQHRVDNHQRMVAIAEGALAQYRELAKEIGERPAELKQRTDLVDTRKAELEAAKKEFAAAVPAPKPDVTSKEYAELNAERKQRAEVMHALAEAYKFPQLKELIMRLGDAPNTLALDVARIDLEADQGKAAAHSQLLAQTLLDRRVRAGDAKVIQSAAERFKQIDSLRFDMIDLRATLEQLGVRVDTAEADHKSEAELVRVLIRKQ